MCQFLMFFAALACFSSDDFSVPFSWVSHEVHGGATRIMEAPGHFGVKGLQVAQREGFDAITIEGQSGVTLMCKVNSCAVDAGGWIFSVKVNTGDGQRDLGSVCFEPTSGTRGNIKIIDANGGVDCKEFTPWNFDNLFNYRMYQVEKESLTVHKFFAQCHKGRAFCVSATFSYRDLNTAVINFGKGVGGEVIGALSLKKTTALV